MIKQEVEKTVANWESRFDQLVAHLKSGELRGQIHDVATGRSACNPQLARLLAETVVTGFLLNEARELLTELEGGDS